MEIDRLAAHAFFPQGAHHGFEHAFHADLLPILDHQVHGVHQGGPAFIQFHDEGNALAIRSQAETLGVFLRIGFIQGLVGFFQAVFGVLLGKPLVIEAHSGPRSGLVRFGHAGEDDLDHFLAIDGVRQADAEILVVEDLAQVLV